MAQKLDVTDRFLHVMKYVVSNKINGITSAKAFLESVGEHQQSKTKLESGTRTPTIKQLVATSKLYGIDTNWLMMGEGKMLYDRNLRDRMHKAEAALKRISLITNEYKS